jgi:DNA-binding MarR family transcriptional regulator
VNADAATRAWRRLRTLVLEQHDRRRDVCEALGMSFIKVKALRRVAEQPMSMRELADRLSIDRPYTTLVVDELERRGLVERTAHPDDRRSKIVTATSAGVEAAATAERILNEPPDAVSALDAADLAALDRITAALAEDQDLPEVAP